MNNHKKSAPIMTMWIDQIFSHIDALHAELDEVEKMKEARRKRHDTDLLRERDAHNQTKRELDELREEKKILHHAHFDALKQLWKLSGHSGTTQQSQADSSYTMETE
jgi:hypothetical protein